MLIICPECKKRFEIEHVEHGRKVQCPCGANFFLDKNTVEADYSRVDEPPPAMIGPYVIDRYIGRGGMGRVYKGKHPKLGIDVAVKTLLPQYAADKNLLERFTKSARICAKMTHPNVVRVYDCGVDKEQNIPYLILELISGGTLFDEFARTGAMLPRKVAEAGAAVCNALEEASKYGIVHRDIKPDNIMIAADGTYKLSDLGLATIRLPQETLRDKKTYSSETSRFVGLGTPEYMPPEQFLDAKNCDIRADIYSLGATLYQLATGRYPFESGDRDELQRAHFEKMPMVPSEIREAFPFPLESIIMRCMMKERSERYQTPAELHADLKAFLSGRDLPSLTGEIAEQPEPEQKMQSAGLSKPQKVILVVAAMIVAMLIAATILFYPDNTPRPDTAGTEQQTYLQSVPLTIKEANPLTGEPDDDEALMFRERPDAAEVSGATQKKTAGQQTPVRQTPAEPVELPPSAPEQQTATPEPPPSPAPVQPQDTNALEAMCTALGEYKFERAYALAMDLKRPGTDTARSVLKHILDLPVIFASEYAEKNGAEVDEDDAKIIKVPVDQGMFRTISKKTIYDFSLQETRKILTTDVIAGETGLKTDDAKLVRDVWLFFTYLKEGQEKNSRTVLKRIKNEFWSGICENCLQKKYPDQNAKEQEKQ